MQKPRDNAFDRGVQPPLEAVLVDRAEAILDFRPDPDLRARIDLLASKSTEDALNATERAEYEGYVIANKFIAILRRQARQLLDRSPAA